MSEHEHKPDCAGWEDCRCWPSPEVERLTDALAAAEARAEKAEANYQFMVNRAADEKLDGYREMGARAASAEARLREVEGDIRGIANHLHALAELPDAQRSVRSVSEAYLHAEEHIRFLVARASRREGDE